MKINCPFASIDKNSITCQLGLYGSKPKEHNCVRCINLGNNNQEFKEKLEKRRMSSHPPNQPKVSGCCDSAENPAS